MEARGQGSQRGIPRLSRIPLPRTEPSSNVQKGKQEVNKHPQTLRPLGTGSLSLRGRLKPSDDTDQPAEYKFGWSGKQVRSRPSITDGMQADLSASLETTPPNKDSIDYIDGDENSISSTVARQKRRPRPSLSERTVETMSQIPPSPSPTRRRPSMTSEHGSNMRPPSRPASSLKTAKSITNIRGRSASPTKQPPGQLNNTRTPLSNTLTLPNYASKNPSTAPRGSIRGLKTAPTKEPRESLSAGIVMKANNTESTAVEKPYSHAQRAKTIHDLRKSKSNISAPRPSLASVLNDPPVPEVSNSKPFERSDLRQDPGRPFGKVTTPQANNAISSSTKVSRPRLSSQHFRVEPHEANALRTETTRQSPKSSTTLRETIAKAKAAKREAARKAAISTSSGKNGSSSVQDDFVEQEILVMNDQKVLQRRIDGAVTSGTLNVAAMALKDLPVGIRTMYDFDENSKVSWSEAVDLTKLIAADNELEELSEMYFPDWSKKELEEDDEKTNQFGGLQFLDVHGNNLKLLPMGLRRLDRLQVLALGKNELTLSAFDIICQISNLKELYMADNKLKGALPLSLAQLTELQILDLHSNQLHSIPENIDGLEKLQKLDLSGNQFTMLPIKSLQRLSLVELNVSRNLLSGTLFPDFLNSERLQKLDVASNKLLCLCSGEFNAPKLQTLVCDRNQLTSLPNMSLLQALTMLSASENKIESLPVGFTDLRELRSVDLSTNSFKVLDPQIANIESLTILNISANPLRDKKYLAMNTDELKTELSKRLQMSTVEAAENSNLPSNTFSEPYSTSKYAYKPENGVLNLSMRNLISVDVSQIDLDQPVHTIRLSNNDLSVFPSELLAHPMVRSYLKVLDISHNQSMHSTAYLADDISLPVLQQLYIVSTGLTSLEALMSHLSAPQLKELNVSCHRMTGSVPRLKAVYPSITTLFATDNWFTSVEADNIRGLEVVDIRNNHIAHLAPKIGELGNFDGTKAVPGRLRAFECLGNRFRVPRHAVLEKGTEAILRDLRRMIPADEVGAEWREQ